MRRSVNPTTTNPASRPDFVSRQGRLRGVLVWALALSAPLACAQTVLIRETVSREVSLHVGGVQQWPVKEVASRETSVYFLEKGHTAYPQAVSRAVSVVNATVEPPTAVTDLMVVASPTGESVALDWSNYLELAERDVERYDIYVSDQPFSDVTGMTPFVSAPAGTFNLVIDGLTAWKDHFFAVVPVDALGRFVNLVTYAASYVLCPEIVSREVSCFVGADDPPTHPRPNSREISLAVGSAAPPDGIVGLRVDASPTGAGATLDWSAYNELAQRDIARYDVYLSDKPFFDVTGMIPHTSVTAETQTLVVAGLAAWRDHFFAVVPVDVLGQFTPAVNYAAAYVISPQVVSREVALFVGADGMTPRRQAVSREVSTVVPDALVPAPVTGIDSGFTATTSTVAYQAIDLAWPLYNEIEQRDVVAYRVYVGLTYFDHVGAMAPYEIIGAATLGHTVGGLESGGIYYLAVVAEDALGNYDPVVRSVSAQASVGGVSAVRNLAVESGTDFLLYTWQPPEEGIGFLDHYKVFFGGATEPVRLPAAATSFMATDLVPAHGYGFQVVAVDVFDIDSGASSLFAATWLANPAVAAEELDEAVRLQWAPATPANLLREYAIYRGDVAFTDVSTMAPLATTNQTAITSTGLTNWQTYHFAVVAVTISDGFSPLAPSVAAMPQPDLTGPRIIEAAPSGVAAVGLDVEQVFLEFTLAFNEPITVDEFTVADIVIVAPDASPVAVLAIDALSTSRFRVRLDPRVAGGTYTIVIGPDVPDLAGNPMDQNENGVNGEAEDAFEFAVDLVTPGLPVGDGDGLLAEYFVDEATRQTSHRRLDNEIDFNWLAGQPHPDIPASHFSAIWTGQVEIRFDGDYSFFIDADDGARLWLNDELLIDGWSGQPEGTLASIPIPLLKGRHDVRLAFVSRGGVAAINWRWTCPFFEEETVPRSQLYSGLECSEFAATPSATPAAGLIAANTGIALETSTTGADIHYAFDDSEPYANWQLYDGIPIPLAVDTTIRAVAVKDDLNRSGTGVFEYEVKKTVLTGAVWLDRDGDGVKHPDDPPLADILVFIDSNGDGQWSLGEPSARSNLAGVYQLAGLYGGVYDIRANPGDGRSVSFPETPSRGYTVTAATGEWIGQLDFGLVDTRPPRADFTVFVGNLPPAQFGGAINDPEASIRVRFNHATWTATNRGDGTWTLDTQAFGPVPDGLYDVELLVEDRLGNAATWTFAGAVHLKSTPPTVVDVSPILVEGARLSRVEVRFDTALAADSVSPADFVLALPLVRAGLPADAVRLEDNNTLAIVQFPPQSANGAYALAVGDDLFDVFGNRMAAVHHATITLRLPDLNLASVGVEPTELRPGGEIQLVWTETNVGTLTANGAWRTAFTLLDPTRVEDGGIPLGDVGGNGPLPVDATRQRQSTLTLPEWIMTGDGLVVQAEINPNRTVLEASHDNNSSDSGPLVSPLALHLSLPLKQVAEDGGTLRCQIGRSGGLETHLDVDLAAAPADKVNFPAAVRIPAGATWAEFDLEVVDNQLVDGDKPVRIDATAPGAAAATAELMILDNDRVELLVTAAADSVMEGETLNVSLSRDTTGGVDEPLLVALAAFPNDQVLIPSTATIPAGQTTMTVTLAAIDDDIYETDTEVLVRAQADGCHPAQWVVLVRDNDAPALTLAVDRDGCSEGDGPQAIVATVARNRRAGAELPVALTVSDPASLSVPRRIVIPAGEREAVFHVGAIDNAQVDGERQVELKATALMKDPSQPEGLEGGSTDIWLTVRDNDGPALTLQADKTVALEGLVDAFTFTLTRNAETDDELVVALNVDLPAELRVPDEVVFAIGENILTFMGETLDDGLPDGNRTVAVRATAPGYAMGETLLTVTDLHLPDLVVADIQVDEQVLAGNTFSLSFTIANRGLGPATSPGNGWTQRVFLSPDPFIGDDQLVGDFRFSGALPVGEEAAFSQTVAVRAPPVNGLYWVVVAADIGGEVDEISSANNAGIGATPILVQPSYSATVATDFESGPAGLTFADVTPIVLYGTAVRTNGQPAAFAPVHIQINLRDYRRVILAVTDAAGEFSTDFTPLPGEGGEYTIGACHPGESVAPVQDQFTLLGMRTEPQKDTIVVAEGASAEGRVTVYNLSEVPLHGLVAEVLDAPPYVEATLELSDTTLAGLAAVTLDCLWQAGAPPGGTTANTVVVRVSSAEGAAVEFPVEVTVQALRPVLACIPEHVYASMPRGEQKLVEITLLNQGASPTGTLTVDLPQAPWLNLATANPLPSIPPGGRGAIVLSLTPAADADFLSFDGRFFIHQENGASLPVPFTFRVVSDALGDLRVVTVNQFHYYAKNAPTLPGATVQVFDGATGTLVAETDSDDDGVAVFGGLREGYYTVVARADKHRESRQTVFVDAGVATPHLAYLVRRTVEVTWIVERVELEDRVEVTIETTFETNVPAPVVVVEPGVIDLGNLTTVGQVERIDLTISNHGLIAAAGMVLEVDTHPFYAIEPLISEIGDLPAMSSLTIPVVLRRIGDYSTLGARASVPCGMGAKVSYDLCRDRESVGVSTSNVQGDCAVPAGGGGGGGGAIGHEEISLSAHGPATGKSLCACILRGEDCPCIIPKLKAGFDCVLGFIPGFDLFKCIYGGGNCIYSYDTSDSVGVGMSIGCASAGLDCISAAGKSFPVLGQVMSALSCVAGAVDAVESCRSRAMLIWGGASATVNEKLETVLTLMHGLAGYRDMVDVYYGDARWLDWVAEERRDWEERFAACRAEDSEDGIRIGENETALLLAAPAGPRIDNARKLALVERWNRTVDYWQKGWFAIYDVPEGESLDFIDRMALYDAAARVDMAHQFAYSLGYDAIWEALTDEWARLNIILEDPYYAVTRNTRSLMEDGQCAKVKLELSQSVVLAREGFEATLRVENGEDITLTDIGADILVLDENGVDAGHLVVVGQPRVTYFTGIDGAGVLTSGATGTAKWLIVPYAEAAPERETVYYVAGRFTYAIDGTPVTIPLEPIPITVHPQAELHLAYYHQRDVFSDDPWTAEVEPAQPFELAVLVRNLGAGDARNLKIISAQPKIVDNEKGLLIDFTIIGHEVEGQTMSPALTADFGDLPAGASRIARWWMTASLQGQFTEYKASFEHHGPFGDPRLSQIKQVDIYELIRSVIVAGQTAFLINDGGNPLAYPDTIHTRGGDRLPVAVVDHTAAVVSGAPSPGNMEVELTTPAIDGWNYLRLVDRDPGGKDYVLVAVRNSLGVHLPPDNFWQTDRTFTFGGVRPTLENNLHLVFHHAAERANSTFTLVYQAADQVGPALVKLALPADAPPVQTQDVFELTFSKTIALDSLTADDFQLLKDGQPVEPLPPLTVSALSTATVSVSGFASANLAPGFYTLAISAVGVTDLFGNPGVGEASLAWIVPSDGPVPTRLEIGGAKRQNTPIGAVLATFSTDLLASSISEANLVLQRDGVDLPLADLNFTPVVGNVVSIEGFVPFCSLEGDYQLTLDADGILGVGGAPGFGAVSTAWTLDTTGPEVTKMAIVERALKPREVRALESVLAVETVRIDFSEPLAEDGFSLAHATLLKDADAVAWPPDATLRRVDADRYELTGLAEATLFDGLYTLRVALAGIRDRAGNAGAGEAELQWRQTAASPTPPAVDAIDPDSGRFDDDFVTYATDLVVRGRVFEEGLAVVVRNDELGVRTPATVDGDLTFSASLTELDFGTHNLVVECENAFGKRAETPFSLFVDTLELTAVLHPPTPSRNAVEIVFSDAVNPQTVSPAAFAMSCNRQALDLAGSEIVPIDETTFHIGNLPHPGQAGTCVFSVDMSGIEKWLSGKRGEGTAEVAWNPAGSVDNVTVTPASSLVDDPILVNTRNPLISGETTADWLSVNLVDAVTRDPLATTEATAGQVRLPLSLVRDGAFGLLLLATDGFGARQETPLEFVVDTQPPAILSQDIYHGDDGAFHLTIQFSEPMNIPLRLADGTFLDGIQLAPADRNATLAVADFSWASESATLHWLPKEPSGNVEHSLTLAAEMLTDLAENPLSPQADLALRFGPLAVDLPEASPAPGETFAVEAQPIANAADYRWTFAPGVVAYGTLATHAYPAGGRYTAHLSVSLADRTELHRSWLLAVGETLHVNLLPGWNAIALPNLPVDIDHPTIHDIFVGDAHAPLVEPPAWGWNAAGESLQSVVHPLVGQGLWLFRNADTPASTRSHGARFVVPQLALAPGLWSFVGVERDVLRTQFLDDHPHYAPTIIHWDAAEQRMRILPPDAHLLRGQAYWLRRLTTPD